MRQFSNAALVLAVVLLTACADHHEKTASNSATTSPTPSPTLHVTFETDAQASARERSTASTPTPGRTASPRPTPTHDDAAPTAALNDPDKNGRLRKLVGTFDALESRVTSIIDQIAGGASSDVVVGSIGQDWYSDERDFQSAIDAIPANARDNPQYVMVKGDLAEAETFLYSAGADAMASCDPANARRELHVSDYFMRAVRKQLAAGEADEDAAADPPQVDSTERKCDHTNS